MRLSWWADEGLSGDAQRWLSNVRADEGFGLGGAVHASPLANRADPEYPVCVELLAALRTQLLATPPPATGIGGRPDSRRPVTVLSVLNRKGPSVANSVIDDVATDMKADVVHLDSQTLARLLGTYFGQNMYWGRGSLATLGYAAAEMNGRLAPRVSGDDGEHEIGMVAVLPSRLRSFLSPKETLTGGPSEGRWEELKITNALSALISSADAKRNVNNVGPPRDLIIHIHDYVEISSLKPVIISKFRMIVDRMWQAGRKVVLVGSSSGDIQKSVQWREQLIEMGREGSHIIPFHSSEPEGRDWMEKTDNLYQNIDNIKDMLQAMLGADIEITFHEQIRAEHAANPLSRGKYDSLIETLSSTLYDVQWVYRLASLIVGGRTPRFQKFTLGHLRYALDFMTDRNKHLSRVYPSVRPPYFSPLFTARAPSVSSFFPSSQEDWSSGSSPSANLPGGAASKEYDQHETKLLSGLINAEDIHTTFNDIIVPTETKESLIGLTSLSLIRPDAFSYGVLKTERIPGCLLYGPPGTGKTLLAKAVAKESGASMLEVSAASINDMWLGQSEKNVRALFSLARKLAPCVIFLDEADALLGARQQSPGRTGHRETITQFLREWDGLSEMRAFIMVATNRPFDLDEAVLRRLPRKILVDLPLKPEREKILGVMLRDESLAGDVSLAQLAAETELYSGSDLKNLCVSAAMAAVREEVRAKNKFEADPENDGVAYVFPDKRVLTREHFEKGLKEISSSISEDMESLKAIRKFDEQYGDSGRKRKGSRKGMGFEVVVTKGGTEEARVRQVSP
ncbi:P-loop containing nucleoside triphosphate hydrolase protein [Cladorrhinum samala]|uniref:P-loop containing nucleoside triphosphate hydrolase protein n=1 Tax=Cladorrhinum samala TaxID=585594 RepID=A0AAV9HYX8_9PEZI|nr:P-loop containing nucleoside triphosphate hydrolase protein [Cladorrhinum samala]